MSATTYKLSIAGNISVGGTLLTEISAPTINVSAEAEELDIIATGGMKAYAVGRKDIAVAFTAKAFTGSDQMTGIAAAFAAGSVLNVSITDTAIGAIAGPFIVSKFDENRAAGKVISYSVELKPTYNGNCPTIGAGAGGGAGSGSSAG